MSEEEGIADLVGRSVQELRDRLRAWNDETADVEVVEPGLVPLGFRNY